MAKYLLTGIDDEQWRHFKANCDIQGITIKEAFLEYIDIVVATFRKHPEYTKMKPFIIMKGDKKP